MSQSQLPAVDMWRSLLQLLQRLPVQSAAEHEIIYDSIHDKIVQLGHLPALDRREWAHLINQLKVKSDMV